MEKKKIVFQMQDIIVLFEIVFLLLLSLNTTIFLVYFFKNEVLEMIRLSSITNGINVAITMIATAESARSITKTASTEVGTISQIPKYKIMYMLKVLVICILMTIICVLMTLYCKFYVKLDTIPDFNINGILECSMTAFISYIVCRYGEKVTENIDLSSIPFFKKR